MNHHHHRDWRPPWEEVETRTGGYYGGGPSGCSGDDDNDGTAATSEYPRRSGRSFGQSNGGNGGGSGGGGGIIQQRRYFASSERHLLMIRQQQNQQNTHHQIIDPRVAQQPEQIYQRSPELYDGGNGEGIRWDGRYEQQPEGVPLDYDDPNDSRYVYDYCPPHHNQPPTATRVASSQGQHYGYEGTKVYNDGRQSYYRDLRRDLLSRNDGAASYYGVGLPVRGAANDVRRANYRDGGVGSSSSPPPLTISTSSGGPADDSSCDDGSQGGPDGGSLLPDPLLDGYNNNNCARDGNARETPPLHYGFKSIIDSDGEPPPQKPTKKRTVIIEVVPGVKMLLRGAKETWEAFVQRKFYVAVNCIGCSAKVFCIKDADYVLCPVCRVISPLFVETALSSSSSNSNRSSRSNIGGLGLGFMGEQQDLRSSEREQKKKIAKMS